ncbi:hypothetical protein KIH27_17620 [Mycobacterium sp. M1]|uniref:Uncharacterized protein n=1 Tax=Mycolicibacter acidiphilus TaxID=2835306 RepID=A0ABS5RMF3_9MYCO|nr:hypothetical protein [Mycolicibacter acidiphilus]MBS9535406.1 hypothetical protein [Mycolicibacter acidiphilus]
MPDPNAESYGAIGALIVLNTAMFAEPDEGRFQRWLYWCIAPALAFPFLALAFSSIVGGLVATGFVMMFLGLGYLRYKR